MTACRQDLGEMKTKVPDLKEGRRKLTHNLEDFTTGEFLEC
jgi:hypothetical protein